MASVFFRSFRNRYDASGLRRLFTPRKPRNALMRLALGLLGIAILAVLLVIGLFVGAAMILFGLLRGALRPRVKSDPRQADALDGEYRVVTKPGQPVLR